MFLCLLAFGFSIFALCMTITIAADAAEHQKRLENRVRQHLDLMYKMLDTSEWRKYNSCMTTKTVDKHVEQATDSKATG